MDKDQKALFDNARRVVVKVGSGVLSYNGGINHNVVASISRQMAALTQGGREMILVSSGAVASGVAKIGLGRRPASMPEKQAAAAIGQAGLILEYELRFAEAGLKVAQVLLTRNDLSHRTRYLNARNTLNTLLSWGVVPIINENDTVVTDEIRFGDNDNLSAMIALLLDADLLINLTDIDALYDGDPRTNPEAKRLDIVRKITPAIEASSKGSPGAVGTGGMWTKIEAAKKSTASGVPMVIASGSDPKVLTELFEGIAHGTYFVPRADKLGSRKRWIAFTSKTFGHVTVDDGAAKALVERGKSLLPSGVLDVSGEFDVGAAVAVCDTSGNELGRGLTNFTAEEIRAIKGLRSDQIEASFGCREYDEVIHRDNLVMTATVS
ncbi:glutamate 5-kinase [Desulfoluna limicola]|uniref:Glutamate 5-kinase n=1 Tax=Desulfoluna limicola TaxID=2810562 RepID=A0ABM7PLR8_9BACT|nr:glutamate 5-kinase [Desulfoluna limicola]BCS98373.1 glutamate 5-kinase [Desulfoluna limicola]